MFAPQMNKVLRGWASPECRDQLLIHMALMIVGLVQGPGPKQAGTVPFFTYQPCPLWRR